MVGIFETQLAGHLLDQFIRLDQTLGGGPHAQAHHVLVRTGMVETLKETAHIGRVDMAGAGKVLGGAQFQGVFFQMP